MYRTETEFRRTGAARQSEVLTTIVDYRCLAPAMLAARDRVAAEATLYAVLPDGEAVASPKLELVRQLGDLAVWLGTWLRGRSGPGAQPSMVDA